MRLPFFALVGLLIICFTSRAGDQITPPVIDPIPAPAVIDPTPVYAIRIWMSSVDNGGIALVFGTMSRDQCERLRSNGSIESKIADLVGISPDEQLVDDGCESQISVRQSLSSYGCGEARSVPMGTKTDMRAWTYGCIRLRY